MEKLAGLVGERIQGRERKRKAKNWGSSAKQGKKTQAIVSDFQ